ncbi:hypothetical protein G4D82_00495 [Flavobacterium sp. CYK-4]|uniref:tetratricopeptide repeat-containing sensor histidine kinase n=1 Tax=Flavobacterium lotistagni TaxID=2709660 RepID=UPI00140B5B80|nr:ATP-binding protein [Flavobacterium lotistagni]NHM05687.1 hypothetical protein [Flavobacterium lotistagni]
MALKKLHFPIVILFSLLIQSCDFSSSKKLPLDRGNDYNKTIETAEKFKQKNKFDSAFYYFNKAKTICDVDNEGEQIIYALIQMSNIQQVLGDYSGSEASATEAIDYFNKKVDPNYQIAIYNLLGIAYEEQLDYDNAVFYYKQSLKLATDNLQVAIIKNNIAVVNISKKHFDAAIQILRPLKEVNEVVKHPETHARILDNLGYSYFKTNAPKAISLLEESLALRKKTGDNFGMIASYYHLSDYYQNKDYGLAKNFALMAYQTATEIKSAEDRLESLNLLIRIASAEESKKYSLIHIALNDSINNAKQIAKNQFAKIKYDSKKEKAENLRLKSQTEKIIIAFIIFLIVVIFSFLLIRSKNRRQQLLSAYEAETKIAKKLHDELANNVFHSMSFLETQDMKIPEKKEVLLDELEKIYRQVRNISKENSAIDTSDKFYANLLEMLSDFNSDTVKVIINKNMIDWKKIQPEKKITVHRILLELMVNMKKHSKCSLVYISFEALGNQIQITYSDNGVGIQDPLFLANGLQNVENRIQAINGTINFETKADNGFKVKFLFPK